MSNRARAGAAVLVVAPLLGVITTLMAPTLSDDSTEVLTATTAHHAAMVAYLTMEPVGITLMLAGLVWLTATLLPHAPRLALTGGILGSLGGLVILFEDGLAAAGPSVVSALDPTNAAAALHQMHSSAASAIEPLALLLDAGIAVLGFAAVKAGAPRWIPPVLTVAALAEGLGHPAASRPLLAVGFAGMCVMLAVLVRSLAPRTGTLRVDHEAVAVA